MTLSIVIPLFNESECIPELYRRLIITMKKDFKKFSHEFIFVDDGSSDQTFEVLKKLRTKNKQVKLIRFSRNFGHHNAITAGMDYAKGDYIVLMDGDLQDQPEEIINLYKKLQEGYDIVYAERKNKQFGFVKNFFSYWFNWFIKKLIYDEIVINSTIFRIMTKQVNDNVKQLRESNRYLVGIIGWVGFTHGKQQVIHGARFKGKTKYSFKKQLDLALNAIFAYSRYPLSIIIKIGLFFISLAMLCFIYSLYVFILYTKEVSEMQLIIATILFVGGTQIIIMGIIGEYIGRNYIESKNRPLYIVKDLLL
jgi:polyisoprenyl-phosphate glycosyltransferase